MRGRLSRMQPGWPRGHAPRGYADRTEAGRALARELDAYAGRNDVIALGLPRGGVPVAAAVAHELGAGLDVFVVRKLGVPWQPELAMGAVASGDVRVLNEDVVRRLHISPEDVDRITTEERSELARRERLYRGTREPIVLAGRVAIVIDDGLATGATAQAALQAARRLGPERLVLAVPVAPAEPLADLAKIADETVCPLTPEPFDAVGQWYDDFRPTVDEDVAALLH